MIYRPRFGWRLSVCACVLLFLTGMASGIAEQNTAELEQLRLYLGKIGNLRAEFTQEVIGPEQEILELASGTVVLSKPGRFRWDYLEPYERIIVADGERIWLYEADLEQVTIRRMAEGLGDTPAALLTGDDEALKQFELLKSWSADNLQWLQLAPVSSEADFSIVELGFASGDLQQIEFVDRLGQRTRLTLSAIDYSPQIIEGDFIFEIPDGVDVIGADDM
jgi:outer membrane lipoprotein carrier protein